MEVWVAQAEVGPHVGHGDGEGSKNDERGKSQCALHISSLGYCGMRGILALSLCRQEDVDSDDTCGKEARCYLVAAPPLLDSLVRSVLR